MTSGTHMAGTEQQGLQFDKQHTADRSREGAIDAITALDELINAASLSRQAGQAPNAAGNDDEHARSPREHLRGRLTVATEHYDEPVAAATGKTEQNTAPQHTQQVTHPLVVVTTATNRQNSPDTDGPKTAYGHKHAWRPNQVEETKKQAPRPGRKDQDQVPCFIQTSALVPNICGYCGTRTTSGCWRRGWEVAPGKYINLCNKCGLRHKAGKLYSAPPPTPSKQTLGPIYAGNAHCSAPRIQPVGRHLKRSNSAATAAAMLVNHERDAAAAAAAFAGLAPSTAAALIRLLEQQGRAGINVDSSNNGQSNRALLGTTADVLLAARNQQSQLQQQQKAAATAAMQAAAQDMLRPLSAGRYKMLQGRPEASTSSDLFQSNSGTASAAVGDAAAGGHGSAADHLSQLRHMLAVMNGVANGDDVDASLAAYAGLTLPGEPVAKKLRTKKASQDTDTTCAAADQAVQRDDSLAAGAAADALLALNRSSPDDSPSANPCAPSAAAAATLLPVAAATPLVPYPLSPSMAGTAAVGVQASKAALSEVAAGSGGFGHGYGHPAHPDYAVVSLLGMQHLPGQALVHQTGSPSNNSHDTSHIHRTPSIPQAHPLNHQPIQQQPQGFQRNPYSPSFTTTTMSHHIRHWTPKHVTAWLHASHCAEGVRVFRDLELDGSALAGLVRVADGDVKRLHDMLRDELGIQQVGLRLRLVEHLVLLFGADAEI